MPALAQIYEDQPIPSLPGETMLQFEKRLGLEEFHIYPRDCPHCEICVLHACRPDPMEAFCLVCGEPDDD